MSLRFCLLMGICSRTWRKYSRSWNNKMTALPLREQVGRNCLRLTDICVYYILFVARGRHDFAPWRSHRAVSPCDVGSVCCASGAGCCNVYLFKIRELQPVTKLNCQAFVRPDCQWHDISLEAPSGLDLLSC